MLTVAEYMSLKCLCGLTRANHAHSFSDIFNPDDIRVVGVMNTCRAFTWEMERELGGNPLANKHLRPLMLETDPTSRDLPITDDD